MALQIIQLNLSVNGATPPLLRHINTGNAGPAWPLYKANQGGSGEEGFSTIATTRKEGSMSTPARRCGTVGVASGRKGYPRECYQESN